MPIVTKVTGLIVGLSVMGLGRVSMGYVTLDYGFFNAEGESASGPISDSGGLPGFGPHSRLATDGSTVTIDASCDLGTTEFIDTGWNVTYDGGSGFSQTELNVTFSVPGPATFAFSGAVSATSTTSAFLNVDVLLADLTTATVVFDDPSTWISTTSVAHTFVPDFGAFLGALTPGHQYMFRLLHETIVDDAGTDATFGATFDLVFAPSPGVMGLAGVGGGAVLRRRRRVGRTA